MKTYYVTYKEGCGLPIKHCLLFHDAMLKLKASLLQTPHSYFECLEGDYV